jgi:hypothetical protein
MADGDPNLEKDSKPVALFLDRLRVDYGCALFLEAHLPNDAKDLRPYGWSGWRRWPEIGVGLTTAGGLVAWRPPRHETPALPKALKRGGAWPFTVSKRPQDVLWAQILEHCAGEMLRPSVRALEKALTASHGSVQRCLDEHKAEWDEMWPDE